MRPSTMRQCGFWFGLCALFLASGAPVLANDKTVIEWRFDAPDDFRGWTVGGLIADCAVRDGALHGRPIGSDPIIFSPVFEIPAAINQCVEFCVKCSEPSLAELYWTQTLEGQYGGFDPEKHRMFHVQGDGQYHVYRIWPFWHAAPKIIRLRFDPPNAGEFDVQWVRVVEKPLTGTATNSWKGTKLRDAWVPSGDVAEGTQGPILLSPVLAVSASENPFVSVRLATNRAGSGRLYCVANSQFGWEELAFPLRPDGKLHSYNLAVNGLQKWRDQIVLLGLQLPTGSDDTTRIESIEVAAEPRGPIEFQVAYFGPSEGIQRAGRPAKISCTIRNLGGELAENVTATLQVGQHVQVLDGAQKTIDRLSLYLPKTVEWQVHSENTGNTELSVQIAAAGAETVVARAELELTQAPDVPQADYVPEPQPVESKYEIGAFYFPGFPTMQQWQPILPYPNRKPILGWYDESNPECADWQIKWAVEHGIDFFMVDWYWVQGNRQLEHWLHNAYGKARYKKYLKWCVMWANHNPPDTHSVEDWRKVTQYWIDNYFQTPEYYRIDNRPAVFIWAPDNVRHDLGDSSRAAKLYAMSQEMAKAAGLPGIYFVAMSGHESPERAKLLVDEGFEAATTYHSFQLAWQRAQSDWFPYASLLDTCPELWRDAEKSAAGLLYLPIVDTGWDPRPWHGEKTMVAYGRTPELFGKLCELGRQFADQTGKQIILLGPVNEWGEGSYIEPYAEYGFEDLDRVRAAFCAPGNWPPNIIPADVGLGPYDLPTAAAKTTWEFDAGDGLEGWTSNGDVADLAVKEGNLVGRSTGRDPIVQMAGLQVEASPRHRLKFRLRSSSNQHVHVFWATTLTTMSEDASLGVDAIGDGQFHDYELELARCSQWRGIVTILRIDPATAPGVEFAFDHIRLQ